MSGRNIAKLIVRIILEKISESSSYKGFIDDTKHSDKSHDDCIDSCCTNQAYYDMSYYLNLRNRVSGDSRKIYVSPYKTLQEIINDDAKRNFIHGILNVYDEEGNRLCDNTLLSDMEIESGSTIMYMMTSYTGLDKLKNFKEKDQKLCNDFLVRIFLSPSPTTFLNKNIMGYTSEFQYIITCVVNIFDDMISSLFQINLDHFYREFDKFLYYHLSCNSAAALCCFLYSEFDYYYEIDRDNDNNNIVLVSVYDSAKVLLAEFLLNNEDTIGVMKSHFKDIDKKVFMVGSTELTDDSIKICEFDVDLNEHESAIRQFKLTLTEIQC